MILQGMYISQHGRCSIISNTSTKAQKNSADPDQTASEEAVWSGSSLFAIENLVRHFVNSSTDNQHFIWEQKE